MIAHTSVFKSIVVYKVKISSRSFNKKLNLSETSTIDFRRPITAF